MADVAVRIGPAAITATSSGSAQAAYTVPAGKSSVIRWLHVVNTTTNPIDVYVSVGADAPATRIFHAFTVYPNDPGLDWSGFWPMVAGEIVRTWAASAGLTISGGVVES